LQNQALDYAPSLNFELFLMLMLMLMLMLIKALQNQALSSVLSFQFALVFDVDVGSYIRFCRISRAV